MIIHIVTKLRIFEILRNIYFDFFFKVQNWDSQQGRDSCLKKLILYNISKIRNFVTCQITFFMTCQQHKSRIRQLLKSWIYSALSMVELLGIYKKMEHQSRGRVGNFKMFFCRNHRQKIILKRKLVFFFLRARVGHLEVSSLTPVPIFFYETRGFICVFKSETKIIMFLLT